ncbi:AI-2E family transporter [Desulfuribacillus alkaliarsenatis]|uniref:AI-2E family transporter n=1 Tax=Desulfuribacillus alkaliarsenatis TaxID=766136 RepID=A0A1E5G0N9_9FIRM|nr:AI-2E family transporter [Desulfuribacillus alkaliarsenatis]OEF96313.1 AI-2E family transporter [Desulfuribacillus alkaliarsenatis]
MYPNWLNKKSLQVLVYIILVLLVILLLQQARPVLSGIFSIIKGAFLPFVVAIIIAYLLNPLVNFLHQKGFSRLVAVLFIYTVSILLIIWFLVAYIPAFVIQLKEFIEHLPDILVSVEGWINPFYQNLYVLPESVQLGIESSFIKVEQGITEQISNLFTFIGNSLTKIIAFVVVPFVVFYMLKDLQVLENFLITIVPKKYRHGILKLFRNIDEALGNYIRGQITVCLVVGVLSYIGYLIIDMKYALVLALIVAITNIVPYLGPIIGAAPAVFIAATISPIMIVKVLVVNITVQQLEGNVISPQIIGKKLQLHPLSIILALLLGGQIAGVLGLIFAVPVLAVLKVVTQHLVTYYTQTKH